MTLGILLAVFVLGALTAQHLLLGGSDACEHEFVMTERAAYSEFSQVKYVCEKCGTRLHGQAP